MKSGPFSQAAEKLVFSQILFLEEPPELHEVVDKTHFSGVSVSRNAISS